MKLWVEGLQLDAGLGGRELPIDLGDGRVALLLPLLGLAAQAVLVSDATRQALTPERTQLDLGDVHP